mgnify:CR=1 FL=1
MNITLGFIKDIFPQIAFLIVLGFNLLMAAIDHGRNFLASFIATIILISITYWGGFFDILLK